MAKIRKIEKADGSIVYRFTVDIGRNPETGRRQQLVRTFDRMKDARAELARVTHETDRGCFVRPSKATVDPFLDQWLASACRDVEASTAASYRDAMRAVRAQLGTRTLQSLREADIERLVDHMLSAGRRRGGQPGTGLSPRTVALTLGRLRTALDEAVRRQLVVRNVAAYVKIPKAARKAAAAAKAELVPWSEVEVRSFLAGIRGERLHAPLLLSLLGLRPAEVCGLRWSDVDLEAGTLAVANTRTLVDGYVVEKAPKSSTGRRTLPLPAPVTAALRALKTRQAAEKLAAGPAYAETGYVLVDELGGPQRTDWLRKRAHALMAQTGVRKVRLYDARHAALTYLATAGVPDVILAAWAGHADGGTLAKRVYIHPNAEHLREASNALARLLG